MISREHRFRGRAGIRLVYQKGQSGRGRFFSIRYALNNRRRSYRAAVVVSRKVHKSAVIRNRLRRRLYEALRQLEPQISGPYDIVINVFDDRLENQPAVVLYTEIHRQLTAAGILRQSKS